MSTIVTAARFCAAFCAFCATRTLRVPAVSVAVSSRGLALVFSTYSRIDSRIDDTMLVQALASEQHGLHGLQRRAEDYRERLGRKVPECIAAGVVDIYNHQVGKKNRLVKWWKAHKGGRLRRPARHPSDG